MIGLGEHLDAPPRDPPVALDRLVGVGVRPHRDRQNRIAALAEFRVQQRRRIGLREQLGFEVEAGRKIVKRVARPREAVDAAMLTAAISVDGAVEDNVGRGVAGDDRFGSLDGDGGAQRRHLAIDRIAIVEPVAIAFALREIEALALAVERRSSHCARFRS